MKEIVVIDKLTELRVHRRPKDLAVVDLCGANQSLNSLLNTSETNIKNSK